MNIHGITGHNVVVNNGWRVVASVFTGTVRVGQNRCAQYVIGIHISAAYAFVDHISQAQLRVPLHIHSHGHKHGNYAGVLAYRAVAHGAHARVNQDLCHGIFSGFTFFTLVSLMYGLNKIDGVIIGNKLQGIGDAIDQVLLADYGGHDGSLFEGRQFAHESPQFT